MDVSLPGDLRYVLHCTQAPAQDGQSVFFPFVLLSCFALFLLAEWGEGEGEAPLERRGSQWVAAGDAGRGWDLGKPLLAASGQQHGPHVEYIYIYSRIKQLIANEHLWTSTKKE